MKIERDIRAIDLIAPLIGTGKILFNFNGQPPILLAIFHLVKLEILFLQCLFNICFTSNLSTSA